MKQVTKYYFIVLLLLIPLVATHGRAHRMRYTTGVQEVGIEGGIVSEGNLWGLCYRHYRAQRLGLEAGMALNLGKLGQYTAYKSFSLKLSAVYHVTPLLTDFVYFNGFSGLLFELRQQEVAKYKDKNETHFNWEGMLGAELECFVLEKLIVSFRAAPSLYFLPKGYDKYRTRFSVGIKWIL